MNIKDLRIPCEPPCTEPYARWCGSRGRATAPSYPIFWSQKNPISGWELASSRPETGVFRGNGNRVN
jgi:hypothetical protein